ncbi:uncharacterized protein LOC131353466 [Hemibagrus wyckioides]|uniref:uncharacterized protein LOC131353464 n=1 Tax=Hemibagrus wyckioides TaxID=337641 RepID=UPI00266BF062|nr:uncharacterized protein LOC131353464 [Hemibagrus wyckioides]XP_058246509.1 uncharacterized protein LOC131353466 [Hemibagrus wyckioides]
MPYTKMKLFIFLIIFGVLTGILISKWKHILSLTDVYITRNLYADTPLPTSNNSDVHNVPKSLNSIFPIKNTSHFAVSAFIDHRLNKAIQVISIIKRNSTQQLYCIYCNKSQDCEFTAAEIEIHTDHFGFPFGASDVLCQGKHTQHATHVAISADEHTDINNLDFLPVKNRMKEDSFKYNFTICISSLFGNYNNVLQFAQTMEMYKLLGVQRVVIYNTSCGPDLEKLLQHYEKAGFLEIVPWPIDQFLKPSAGWNIKFHKGDIQYYGQLVTLNECIYRHMYQSKYVLLNDIDEIIMPYKYANLALLMEALQQEHKEVTVFLIENHIFPKTQFEETGKFHQPEWKSIPGINIMEHIYREPDRKNIYNPTKMIINPRNVIQTSVHSSLKHIGRVYKVPFDVCRIVHVRIPLQGSLTKEQLFVDTRVWDFDQELIPNVNRALQLSGLLKSQ